MNAIEFINVSKKFRKGEKFDSLRDFIPNLVRMSLRGPKGRSNLNIPDLRDQEFWAVKDVSFELKKGEALGIIGPNGAGKSTILKMLSRIYKPTSGEIKINGKLSALLEVGAGFHPDLTGRENIYLSGAIIGMKKKEIESKIDSIIEFSELEDFIDTPVKKYSSGMYVRLGFSISAHMDPEILLLDEVLAVGDMGFQAKCIERIKQLEANNVTIIFISHNIDAVLGLCKRTITLSEGNVYFQGKTEEAIYKYKELMNKRKLKTAQKDTQAVPNQAVTIENIVILDEFGNIKNNITTGDKVTFRMEFTANKKINKPAFGIALHRSDGVYVYGTNTSLDKYIIEQIVGKGAIELTYESLDLLGGEYYVSAGISAESGLIPHDFHDKQYNFFVNTTKNDQGLIYLDHKWNIKDSYTKIIC